MANLYLNLGINVADLYKDVDKAQLKKIEQAAADGFSTDELKTLEEDGIDISLIKDNAVENPAIEEKDTDSPELNEAKQQLKTINKDILNDSTKLRELEAEIILLEDEVSTEFANLVDKQNQLKEEQKDAIKEAQQKAQEKYTNSDGEMTQEEYKESLMNELNGIDSKYGSAFSAIAKGFLENNKKQAELNAKIDTQNTLVENVKTNQHKAEELSTKITQMQTEHEAKLQAATAAQGAEGAVAIGNNIPDWMKGMEWQDRKAYWNYYNKLQYSQHSNYTTNFKSNYGENGAHQGNGEASASAAYNTTVNPQPPTQENKNPEETS